MRQRYIASRKISIHLMLLFIIPGRVEEGKKDMFQYISCYSLSRLRRQKRTHRAVSIHLMLLFILLIIWLLLSYGRFNTSHVTLYRSRVSRFVLRDSFQYISCYSLSSEPLLKLLEQLCFNTSHVTLYQYTTWASDICRSNVSIHLMLLFIPLLYSISHT